MKTNVTMVRKMGNLEVHQRTKDGMFNATSLLKQWNEKNPKSKKEKVQLFFNNDNTKEFLSVLEESLNGQEITHLTSRGKQSGGTWMHPYLFIKFAMWLSPKFELSVIKFVYDELIKNRLDAGDGYIMLSSAGVKLKGYDFVKVATAMQWIVYDKTGKNMRQSSTQEQLQELNDIQKKLAFAINMGYINTFEKLISEMQRMYRIKYLNLPF